VAIRPVVVSVVDVSFDRVTVQDGQIEVWIAKTISVAVVISPNFVGPVADAAHVDSSVFVAVRPVIIGVVDVALHWVAAPHREIQIWIAEPVIVSIVVAKGAIGSFTDSTDIDVEVLVAVGPVVVSVVHISVN